MTRVSASTGNPTSPAVDSLRPSHLSDADGTLELRGENGERAFLPSARPYQALRAEGQTSEDAGPRAQELSTSRAGLLSCHLGGAKGLIQGHPLQRVPTAVGLSQPTSEGPAPELAAVGASEGLLATASTGVALEPSGEVPTGVPDQVPPVEATTVF